jgi:hypothetical protein
MSSHQTTVPDHKALNQKYVFEGTQFAERHHSRLHSQEQPSINFVSHTPINTNIMTRQQEGGSFPTKVWSKAQERLGTSQTGHRVQYLISDLVH